MKISIIVAVRNAEKTIERCIKSILCQKSKNVELIIIDGKSTDDTLGIVKKYGEKIDILVSEKDKGVYDAMNKGIRYASGDVLAFLNSDDWYCENVMEWVEEIFKNESNIKMVYGDVLLENKLVTSKRVADDNFLNTLLNFNICHQCVFTKKEVFENIGVFNTEYQFAAEYDWMLRLVLSGIKTFHDNRFYVHYSTGGLSEKHTGEHSMEAWNSSKRWIQDEELLKISRKRYQKNMAKNFWQKTLKLLDEDGLEVIKEGLKQKNFDSHIVIYGAGRFGRELKMVLDSVSVRVEAFIDKNYQEIKNIEGMPVISFESYIKKYKECKVIISPINGYEEIEKMFNIYGLLRDENYLVLIEFLIELSGC